MIKPGLYKAKEIQFHDGIPFQKIDVVCVENGMVIFTTEWPVRKLEVTTEDFNSIFIKWE